MSESTRRRDEAIDLSSLVPTEELGGLLYTYLEPGIEMDLLFYRGSELLRLGNISIDPSMRRQGYGRALIEGALQLAEHLHAKQVSGTIKSPEGYALMRSLFGPQYFNVPNPTEISFAHPVEFAYDLTDTDPTVPAVS